MKICVLRTSSIQQLTIGDIHNLQSFDVIYSNLDIKYEGIKDMLEHKIISFEGSISQLINEIKGNHIDSRAVIVADVHWKDYYGLIREDKIDILNPYASAGGKFIVDDLVEIMDILRSKQGCPWDVKQSHQSLKPYLLEECYEALEAIDNEDYQNLMEELGDVLLQVVFHSSIASSQHRFSIFDVIDGITSKLVIRHPHVFGDWVAEDENEAVNQWESIKKQKKGNTEIKSYIEVPPKHLPSLLRSTKVQQEASKVGFDWDNISDVIDKVGEELKEFTEAVKKGYGMEEEFGDLLFSMANLSRFIKINPEIALNKAVYKFIRRFRLVEGYAQEIGQDLQKMDQKSMDELWNRAKST